jgi:hypothetical protein
MAEPTADMPKANFHGGPPEREFWRDLAPVKQVFRPGSLPEAYIGDAATDDERFPYYSEEQMRVTFNVTGPLVRLDANGQATGTFEVFDYFALCREHYDRVGLGADLVEKLFC